VPPVTCWADRTTLWRVLRLWALQLPYPASDTAQQDALNCTSVKVVEGLMGQSKIVQPPEVEEVAVAPSSTHCLCGWTISDCQ
jgi:hypothetical protein